MPPFLSTSFTNGCRLEEGGRQPMAFKEKKEQEWKGHERERSRAKKVSVIKRLNIISRITNIFIIFFFNAVILLRISLLWCVIFFFFSFLRSNHSQLYQCDAHIVWRLKNEANRDTRSASTYTLLSTFPLNIKKVSYRIASHTDSKWILSFHNGNNCYYYLL